MAVAAPARRSKAAASPPPPLRSKPKRVGGTGDGASPRAGVAAPAKRRQGSGTAAPAKRRKASGTAAPAKRKASPRAAAAAPARAPSRRKPATAPRKPAAPGKRKANSRGKAKAKAATAAPARRSLLRTAVPASKPHRRLPSPGRSVAAGGQLIPLAVGRSAAAVRHLPDSGLIVRMTRGRLWIGVLGVLLVGIVALNVVTLSFAASSGKIDLRNTALEQENRQLQGREANAFGATRTRNQAAQAGLAMPTASEPTVIRSGRHVVEKAAARLAEAEAG